MQVTIVNRIVLFCYLTLLMVGLTIPSSGSHSIFHPKSLSSLLVVFTTGGYFIFFKRAITKRQFYIIYGLIVFLCFILLWLIFGCLNKNIEEIYPFDQFKLYLITLIVPLASLLLFEEKLLGFSLFLKTLLYANAVYVLFKIICVMMLFLDFVTFDKLTDLLGIRAMGMAIFGNFQRFQTSMDITTPFLLFFCLESPSFATPFPKWFKWTYPPVALFSTIVSFSRVLIFVALVGICLHFCLHSLKHFFVGVILFFISCLAGMALMGPDNVYKMVEVRLFSKENQESDDIRQIQVNALMEEYANNPLLGMGLGGYSEKEVRDLEIKHSYEVQWVALLAQLGFLGFLLLLLPLLFLSIQFFFPPIKALNIAIAILWIGWLAAGFTNPFVISLTSGIIYSLFILAALSVKKTVQP